MTTEASSIELPAFDERWDGAVIAAPQWHFHRRLLERYGVVLGPGEFSRIIRDIRRGRAIFIERRGKDATLHAVEMAGACGWVFVLYCRGRPKTVLPPSPRRWKIRKAVEKQRRRVPAPISSLCAEIQTGGTKAT